VITELSTESQDFSFVFATINQIYSSKNNDEKSELASTQSISSYFISLNLDTKCGMRSEIARG
jgi:hypothetical protein